MLNYGNRVSNNHAMLDQPKLQLALDNYHGPLDLLLNLIEQQRLDITAISLAEVADQYMRAVMSMAEPAPDVIAEFLVIGAKLLVIKTRALLPRPPAELRAPDDDDVGDQLARQLREYKRFKSAAAQLRAWDQAGYHTFTRQPEKVPALAPRYTPEPAELPRLDVSLADLVATMQRRLQLLLPLDETVPLPAPKIITIAAVRERIRQVLGHQPWTSFEDLLSLAMTRNEVIVTLWTVLELFKRQQIVIEQDALYGPISIGRGSEFDPSAAAPEEAFDD